MQVASRERRQFRFGAFVVNAASHELWNDGQKLTLQEKPFQLLVILLEQPGELVTREELRRRLWPEDTFVDFEHSINTAIKKIRDTLGDSGKHPKYVETLPRLGYRFVAQVEAPEEEPRHPGTTRPDEKAVAPAGRARSARFSRSNTLWVGLSLLVVLAVVYIVWHFIPLTPGERSVAVLPFADLSPGHDQEYFSKGLSEDVLNHLTKIPHLKVVARTSSFQFKGNEDPQQTGKKLNVENLLEGSVQKLGDRVRVSARLIKVSSGESIWSENFDRDSKDIFAVEDDIANKVTAALQIAIQKGQKPTTQPTSGTTPEAYEAVLQARYFWRMNDEASAKKALGYVNKAIELDPKYAPAYALRASIALRNGNMMWSELTEAIATTRRDTERAIALDPNLADGYRILSELQAEVDSNCPAAERSLKRAQDLSPQDPDTLDVGALIAMCHGRQEDAVKLWKQELALDPLRPDEYLWLAQVLRDLGRYEEARADLSKALDLNSKGSMTHEILGELYLLEKHPQEAQAEMEKESDPLFRNLGEAFTYHALGRQQDSDAALGRLIKGNSDGAAYQIAQVYGYRGETDKAFEWLNRAYDQHDAGLLWVKTDLKFASLRNDPRYPELLKKLNLTP